MYFFCVCNLQRALPVKIAAGKTLLVVMRHNRRKEQRGHICDRLIKGKHWGLKTVLFSIFVVLELLTDSLNIKHYHLIRCIVTVFLVLNMLTSIHLLRY